MDFSDNAAIFVTVMRLGDIEVTSQHSSHHKLLNIRRRNMQDRKEVGRDV